MAAKKQKTIDGLVGFKILTRIYLGKKNPLTGRVEVRQVEKPKGKKLMILYNEEGNEVAFDLPLRLLSPIILCVEKELDTLIVIGFWSQPDPQAGPAAL